MCHRTWYGGAWQRAVEEAVESRREAERIALALLRDSMAAYLAKKAGKRLHDPLALAVAIDPRVARCVEVQAYCDGGKWGSYLSEGSGVWISVDYSEARFVEALLPDVHPTTVAACVRGASVAAGEDANCNHGGK